MRLLAAVSMALSQGLHGAGESVDVAVGVFAGEGHSVRWREVRSTNHREEALGEIEIAVACAALVSEEEISGRV